MLNNKTCAILGDLGCRSEQACNVGKDHCREPNRGNTGPPLLPSCLSKGDRSVSSPTKEEEIFEFVLRYDVKRIMRTTFKCSLIATEFVNSKLQ